MSGPPAPGSALSVEELVEAALAEDLGDGDRTTLWSVPAGAWGRAVIRAREDGVVAGTEPAARVFHRLDPELAVRWRATEGEGVREAETVAVLEGRLRPILSGERTALNFLGRLSGIATLAARYVRAVEGTGCRIADTRKTAPGWRVLEKRAAAAGGAVNHRMGLHDMVLLKENHLAVAGGVAAALAAVRDRAREEAIAVEVEVRAPEELEEALAGAPDRILLDNMTVPELEEAVRAVRRSPEPRPELEASGGVDLESVGRIARTGVDVVSVGRITHSAPALDFSLLVEAS